MIDWIVSSSVLIVVVLLLRLVLKGRISLRLQYALWALVLVRLLVPGTFGGSPISIEYLTQKAAAAEPMRFVSALSGMEFPAMSYQAAYAEVEKEYAEKGIQIADLPTMEFAETVDYEIMNRMNGDVSAAEVVTAVWICGILVVGGCFFFANLRLHRRLKRSRSLLTDAQALPIYLSNAVDTPCMFGLLHPAVYLTGEAVESEQIKRHAVGHELTHYRHGDHIWAILRCLCLAVHWYNPLVWYAAVLSVNDAELACDESTILRLGEEERAAYGRTLLCLTCEKRPALLQTATTMTGSGKRLRERIALIVKRPQTAFVTLLAVIFIAVLTVGCTFTGAQTQPAGFEEWTGSLTRESIEWAELAKGYGLENVAYTIPESEFEDLSALLGSIRDENCFRKKPEADDKAGYRLALYREKKLWLFKCLDDGTIGLMFNDPETGAYYGSEGALLIIESPELWDYIVHTVDERGTANDSAPVEKTNNDEETAAGNQSTVLTGYITIEDGLVYLDAVEIITQEDTERAEELELDFQDLISGYYLHNEVDETTAYQLSKETVYRFVDIGHLYTSEAELNYETADPEEFLTGSSYAANAEGYASGDAGGRIPYFVEVRGDTVVSITEEFAYTI